MKGVAVHRLSNPAQRQALGRALAKVMEFSRDSKTQTALAQKSGVGQTTIGRILRGEVSPQTDTLQLLCDALKISPGVLLDPTAGSELARVEQLSMVTNLDKINRFYRYLGRLFTQHRLKRHLSQEQLAGEMKVAVDWVKAIESMTRDVNVLDVANIATFFKVSIQELLKDAGL